jgi:hypothetical protein
MAIASYGKYKILNDSIQYRPSKEAVGTHTVEVGILHTP